jgi:molecular chaperone DnaK
MSQEDIDKAVKEAEQFAEEDRKFKELVETKNQAESMVSQTEKILSDAGDKISEDDKAAVRAEAEALKASISSNDVETIKAALDKFQKKFYEVSEKLYKAAGADMGADAAGSQNEDGSFNADFTEK